MLLRSGRITGRNGSAADEARGVAKGLAAAGQKLFVWIQPVVFALVHAPPCWPLIGQYVLEPSPSRSGGT
jgi:hypothetical protein